jgi:hypothetical protein
VRGQWLQDGRGSQRIRLGARIDARMGARTMNFGDRTKVSTLSKIDGASDARFLLISSSLESVSEIRVAVTHLARIYLSNPLFNRHRVSFAVEMAQQHIHERVTTSCDCDC